MLEFKLNLAKECFGENGIQFEVISEPVPCIVYSKWKIVNWWRKLRGTEQGGYKYDVKIIRK
jgi:hypothetical protein